MTTAIYCKGGRNWVQKARAAAINVFGENEVPDLNMEQAEAPNVLIKHSALVVHVSEAQWNSIVESRLKHVRLIIRVSSVGLGGMSYRPPFRLNGTGPWVLYLSECSDDVTTETWNDIFTSAKALRTNSSDLPPALLTIFEPTSEARCALRLLCEAWLMNKGVGTKEHKGLKIYAPVMPEQWFHPFQAEPTETDAINIAKQMGNAETAAREFLKRAAQLWDGRAQRAKGELSWATFEKPVRKLKDALEAAIR